MQSPEKLIVANWKMNTTLSEGSLLINRLRKELGKYSYAEIVLCVPFTHIYPLSRELKASNPHLELGAQNISEHEQGAYTGEISAAQLKNLVEYVIVGHSERRKYFNETDTVDAMKLQQAVAHSLKPILCVGETKQQRNDGHSKQVVLDQLNTCLMHVSAQDVRHLTIAYEPVWAIGTGNTAKPSVVEEMVLLIRNTLAQRYGRMASMHVRVLYGGSVEPETAKTYLQLFGVDGLLVGGASLNYKKFAEIVLATQPDTGK